MVSLRENILGAVVSLIDAKAPFSTGGGCVELDSRKPLAGGTTTSTWPMALVDVVSEGKSDDWGQQFVNDLNLEIWIVTRRSESDTRSDARVLLELVTAVEQALLADPERKLGLTTDGVRELHFDQGYTIIGPDSNNRLFAVYDLRVSYEHSETDPEALP